MSSLYQVCGIGVRPGEPPSEQTLQVTHVRVVSLPKSVSRPDCEAAIREILEQTGGKCPLCPANKGWVWGGAGNEAKALDWSMFTHFSRTHRITQGLTYSDNKPNLENVEKILSRFKAK